MRQKEVKRTDVPFFNHRKDQVISRIPPGDLRVCQKQALSHPFPLEFLAYNEVQFIGAQSSGRTTQSYNPPVFLQSHQHQLGSQDLRKAKIRIHELELWPQPSQKHLQGLLIGLKLVRDIQNLKVHMTVRN